eukprot:4987725-Pleurochrysis_carterae.AAC.1
MRRRVRLPLLGRLALAPAAGRVVSEAHKEEYGVYLGYRQRQDVATRHAQVSPEPNPNPTLDLTCTLTQTAVRPRECEMQTCRIGRAARFRLQAQETRTAGAMPGSLCENASRPCVGSETASTRV